MPEDHALVPDELADALWTELQPARGANPQPARPVCVLMVGVPLSGKSTLARRIAADAATATVRVENDAVRARVASVMGRDAPEHDRVENYVTYETAWRVLRHALGSGSNAIHDATNLSERGRKGAYAAADDAGAQVLVVFVQTPPHELAARYASAPAHRKAAFDALGGKRPNPDACSRPFVIVDGTDLDRALDAVLEARDAMALTVPGQMS